MSNFKIKKVYPKNITNVFDTLTITGEYRIIGSASLEKIKYNSDYDLEELIKDKSNDNTLTKIYKYYKDKFKFCKKDKRYFITDFKCGIGTDGEPLRWDYKKMMKGINDGITFQQALLMKSTIKMDMIVLIDKIYTEFSENYYFKLGQDTNYYKDETKNPDVGIQKSLDEYLYTHNFWKALKRIFSLLLQDKKKNKTKLIKLMDYFNSSIGLINKCKNELDILLVILEQKFRIPDINDIKYNISVINEWGVEAGLNKSYFKKFLSLLNKTSLISIKKSIEKIRDDLFNIINKYSLDFLQTNFKNII
jgi:hypothetical protein